MVILTKKEGPYDSMVTARANYIGKCLGFRVEGYVEGRDFDFLETRLKQDIEWYENVSLKDYALHIVNGRRFLSAMDRKVLRKALADGQANKR